jgi:hypothetical protein
MKTKTTVRNCKSSFRFQCPQAWDELAPTASPEIRHCGVCDCDVFFCTTDDETIDHARAGHCIARELPDERELPHVYIGQPQGVPLPLPEHEVAQTWFDRERAIDDSVKNADAERSCPKCNYPAPPWRETCRVCGYQMGRSR